MPPADPERKSAAEPKKRDDMVGQLDRLITTMTRKGDADAAREDLIGAIGAIGAIEAYAQAYGAQRVWHEVVARRERPGKTNRDGDLETKLAEARNRLVEKFGHTSGPPT